VKALTNITAPNAVPASCWHLQAERWVTASPSDGRQLADKVTQMIQELDLRSQQRERAQKAVLEAVQRASLRGQSTKPVSLVHIRIWIAGKCAPKFGLGFFIVDKPGSACQGASLETERLVELFLYQERDS